MREWEGIIIHHSDTKDDASLQDWTGIRAFHKSWRYQGDTITEEKARGLLAAGVKGVESPWHDIGYHFGIERVAGVLVVQEGRTLIEAGAACVGKNGTHIQICVVGDFDLVEPSVEIYTAAADLCVRLMKIYPKITPATIEPHRKYAPKTCPGSKFDMARLIQFIMESAKNGQP
jgi:hypothetical protein